MKWCCSAFKDHHENAGRRGITIFATLDSEQRYFFLLQSRAIDVEDKTVGHTMVPVAFATQIAVKYCPWCGRRLARAYRKHIPEILRQDLMINYKKYSTIRGA